MSKFNLANILTTLRILLILPFAYFLLQNNYLIAGILIIVATLLDYENWLTKKTNDELAFKNMYDKIADIIIITAAILLVVYIKFWFTYEALIAIGAILIRGVGVYLINRKYNFIKSTHWTKAAGLLLIIGVIVIVNVIKIQCALGKLFLQSRNLSHIKERLAMDKKTAVPVKASFSQGGLPGTTIAANPLMFR